VLSRSLPIEIIAWSWHGFVSFPSDALARGGGGVFPRRKDGRANSLGVWPAIPDQIVRKSFRDLVRRQWAIRLNHATLQLSAPKGPAWKALVAGNEFSRACRRQSDFARLFITVAFGYEMRCWAGRHTVVNRCAANLRLHPAHNANERRSPGEAWR